MERMTGMLRGNYLGDGLLAVALTVFGQLNLRFNIDGSTRYGPTFATAATTALATAVIALRRRAPLLTVCVVTAAMAGPELVTRLTITLWGSFVPLVIAVYSVARHEKRRAAAAGAVVAALGVVVVMLRVPVIGTAANIPFTFVPCAGAFAAGRILRLRHDRHVEVSDRARALEAGREETIRTAVEEERGRIARELHDIVAHSISVMVVQAGAAEDLLDRNPPLARPALQAVQETGRQAVTELTRMLGLLRGDRGALGAAPAAGYRPAARARRKHTRDRPAGDAPGPGHIAAARPRPRADDLPGRAGGPDEHVEARRAGPRPNRAALRRAHGGTGRGR